MSASKDQYDTEQADAQQDRQDIETSQKTLLGSDGGVDVTQMANDVKNAVPAHSSDFDGLTQDQATLDQFTKDAPNLAFNLPFGLGKLFNLPGYRQDQAAKAKTRKPKS